MLNKIKSKWWSVRYKDIVEDIKIAIDDKTCDLVDKMTDREIIGQASGEMMAMAGEDGVIDMVPDGQWQCDFWAYVFGRAVISSVETGLVNECLIDEFYLFHVKFRAVSMNEHKNHSRATAKS